MFNILLMNIFLFILINPICCHASSSAATTINESKYIKLLLVRNLYVKNKCIRCVPGVLYTVSDSIRLSDANSKMSGVDEICYTIENGIAPNIKNWSMIPEGTYNAHIRMDASKPWMWTGNKLDKGEIIKDRAWRLELENIAVGDSDNRVNIQFHYGKDASWSWGCIILSKIQSPQCSESADACISDSTPENVVAKLREYVEQQLSTGKIGILIKIVDGNAAK